MLVETVCWMLIRRWVSSSWCMWWSRARGMTCTSRCKSWQHVKWVRKLSLQRRDKLKWWSDYSKHCCKSSISGSLDIRRPWRSCSTTKNGNSICAKMATSWSLLSHAREPSQIWPSAKCVYLHIRTSNLSAANSAHMMCVWCARVMSTRAPQSATTGTSARSVQISSFAKFVASRGKDHGTAKAASILSVTSARKSIKYGVHCTTSSTSKLATSLDACSALKIKKINVYQ